MKKCLWCSKTELNTTFLNLAHTIPESLGGSFICENVCDPCNTYFGAKQNRNAEIDLAIKETFYASYIRFLLAFKQIGKSKELARVKSFYFQINIEKLSISTKPAFKYLPGFQQSFCRQFKKGLYKMFLEESERQFGNGHNSEFDFIREFARFDLGDPPVYYYYRLLPFITTLKPIIKPEFSFDKRHYPYLVEEPGFFEFEFLGHVFGIPISRSWDLVIHNYLRKSRSAKGSYFRFPPINIRSITEIDIFLKCIHD